MDTDSERMQRQALVRGVYGSWGRLIQGEDGRLDIERQLSALRALRVNTFNYFIFHHQSDWEDCQRFLPAAAEAGLQVWITLLSPWQAQRHGAPFGAEYQGGSYPFGVDFLAWCDAIGQVAARHPNLTCVSIDDFDHKDNLQTFTPAYLREMMALLRQNRSDIAFCPTIYGVSPTLLDDYLEFLDGVMLWWTNLDIHLGMKEWLWANQTIVAGRFPIVAGVYARSTTWHPAPPTLKTFRRCLRIAREGADGVMIFRPDLAAGAADPIVAYLMQG